MSLEKAIKYNKEKRKPYYKSKRFDKTCRNHGSCPYCKNNRLHKHILKDKITKEEIKNHISVAQLD